MSPLDHPFGADLPGGYQLRQRLGSGAFGEVWRAEAPGGIEVAVKIILRALKPDEAERELQALQAIKRLRHQYLLALQAIFSLEDRLVIVLELADHNLRQRLNECRQAGQGGIPPAELLDYVGEVAEALDYLHAHKVQHRDIKTENLLLLGRHVKVADFGLARVLEEHSLHSASTVGTPAYMAPEVWDGKLTVHSDQYSLAVAYVELRLGRLPFAAPNLAELIYCHLQGQPDLAPLEEAERDVVLRALAKSPDQRYPSCCQFAHALEQVVPVEPRRRSRLEQAPVAEPALSAQAELPGVSTAQERDAAAPLPRASEPCAGGPAEAQHTSGAGDALTRTVTDAGPAERRGSRATPPARRGRSVVVLVGGLLAAAGGLLGWNALDGSREAPDAPLATRPAASEPPVPPKGDQGNPQRALQLLPLAAVTLETATAAALKLRVQRRNCEGPVRLEVSGLPAGVRALPALIPADRDEADLYLTAAVDAAPAETTLTVRAESGGLRAERTTRLSLTALPVVSLPPIPAVTVQPGQARTFQVRLDRHKLQGPVKLLLEGAPAGVEGWSLVVPAKSDAGAMWLDVRKHAELGSQTVRVVAVAAGARGQGKFLLTIGPKRSERARLIEDGAAIDRAPKDPLAHHNRGLTRREFGAYEQAIADFDEAIRLDPSCAHAYNGRGSAYRMQANYDHALQDYTAALQRMPEYAVVYANRSLLYYTRRDQDRALADINAAIRLEPWRAHYYNHRGLIYSRSKDQARAADDFERAIALDPKYPYAYINRGNLALAKLDYAQALAGCNEALRVAPREAYAYAQRGLICFHKKDYDKAAADYDRAIALDPKLPHAYVNRSRLSLLKKDYAQALADATEAIRVDPTQAGSYDHRTSIYFRRKEYTKAAADCEHALALDPQSATPYVNRGYLAYLRGDSAQAIAEYERAIRLDPHFARAYNNRALVYVRLQEYDKAARDYAQAIALEPKYAIAHVNRGDLLFARKDYAGAIKSYSEAIELVPNHAGAHFMRGRAYAESGDAEQARRDRAKALELDPGLANR